MFYGLRLNIINFHTGADNPLFNHQKSQQSFYFINLNKYDYIRFICLTNVLLSLA